MFLNNNNIPAAIKAMPTGNVSDVVKKFLNAALSSLKKSAFTDCKIPNDIKGSTNKILLLKRLSIPKSLWVSTLVK